MVLHKIVPPNMSHPFFPTLKLLSRRALEQEFEKMKEKVPENFRLDFAVSREQTNEKGEKMYIQTRMAQYAEELWELLKKDSTYVYMCGLKGMEKGIDEIMTPLAAKDGKSNKKHNQNLMPFLYKSQEITCLKL